MTRYDRQALHQATTDASLLAEQAYADDRHLAARQSLYHYQRPVFDLPQNVIQLLADRSGLVVDAGCGNGRYLDRLRSETELRVLGVDISSTILADVSPAVVCADASRLPLADDAAEAVLAMHMLYHLPDIVAGIEELARVTRPGGLLIASTNVEDDKHELDELWATATGEVLDVSEGPRRVKLSETFSLDAGAELIDTMFGQIHVTELKGVIEVDCPDPILAHLQSYESWAQQVGVPFDAVMERVHQRLNRKIERDGFFEVTTRQGILSTVLR